MAKGFNALFIAPGFGAKYVPVRKVLYGMEIESNATHGRQKQTMYVTRVKTSAFGIRLHYADYDEYRDMTTWLRLYGTQLSNPVTKVGPIRVVVPSVKFDRTGIPSGAIPIGESVDRFHYPLDLVFDGTSSPITAGQSPSSGWWSRFVLPSNEVRISEHFYPAGVQLSGDYGDEDSLYAPYYEPVQPASPATSGGNGGGGGGVRFR